MSSLRSIRGADAYVSPSEGSERAIWNDALPEAGRGKASLRIMVHQFSEGTCD